MIDGEDPMGRAFPEGLSPVENLTNMPPTIVDHEGTTFPRVELGEEFVSKGGFETQAVDKMLQKSPQDQLQNRKCDETMRHPRKR